MKTLKVLILSLAVFVLAACQGTGSTAEPMMERLNLTVENPAGLQSLVGVWDGTWYADNGSSNGFKLNIAKVSKDGEVTASRTYQTRYYGSTSRPTRGTISDGELWLDAGKGPDVWIKFRLYKKPKTKELWLKGRYSTIGGGTVYLGDLEVTKSSK